MDNDKNKNWSWLQNLYGGIPNGITNPLNEIRRIVPKRTEDALKEDVLKTRPTRAQRALNRHNEDIRNAVSEMTWNQKRAWFDELDRQSKNTSILSKEDQMREEDREEYDRRRKEQEELLEKEDAAVEKSARKTALLMAPLTVVPKPLSGILSPRMTYDLLSGLHYLRSMAGSADEDRRETRISTLTGRMDLLDGAAQGADIHKQMQQYRKRIEKLELMRAQYALSYLENNEKLLAANKDQRTQQYLLIDEQLKNEIDRLKLYVNDPDNIAAENEYKRGVVYGIGGMFDGIKAAGTILKQSLESVWDSMKSWSLNSVPGQAEHLRQSVMEDRKNATNNEYEALLQDELNKKLEKGSYNGNIDDDVAEQFKKRVKERKEDILKDIQEEVLAKEEWKNFWKVSEAYRKGKELYQAEDLASGKYWYYIVPGTIGSSSSSYYQLAGTAMQAAGAVGSLVTGSPGMYNVSTVATIPLSLKGASEENEAEASQKRTDNILEFIASTTADAKSFNAIINDLKQKSINYWVSKGMSREDAEERVEGNLGAQTAIRDLQSGFINSEHPNVKKALLCSTQGLSALYWANNIRTGGETAIQTMLDLIPGGKFKRASRDEILDAAENTAKRVAIKDGKIVAEDGVRGAEKAGSRHINGFRKKTVSESYQTGKNVGENLGDALGFGYIGSKIGGVVGGATAAGYRKLAQSLPGTAGKMLEDIEFAWMRKYQGLSDILALGSNRARLLERYAARLARRAIKSSFSEGAEEATQYMNSKQVFEDYGLPNIQQLISNDLTRGKDIFNVYLSYLGLSDSEYLNDADFVANWKGGFALGGAHTTTMSFLPQAISDFKEYKASNFLYAAGAIDREHNKNIRTAGVSAAKAAMDGNAAMVLQTLDNMEAADRRRRNPNFTQEDYDEQRHMVTGIMLMATNDNVRKMMETRGIDYGTDKYAYAVADLYHVVDRRKTNEQGREANGIEKDRFYGNQAYENALDEAVKILEAADPDITMQANKLADIAEQAARKNFAEQQAAKRKNKEEGSEDENNPIDDDSIDRLNDEVKEARRSARESVRNQIKRRVKSRQRLLDKASALLYIMGQTSTIRDTFKLLTEKFGLKTLRPDAKIIDANLKQQFKDVKAQIKDIDPNFDENMTEEEFRQYINDNSIIDFDRDEADRINVAEIALDAEDAISARYYALATRGAEMDENGNIIKDEPSKTYVERYGKHIDAVMKADQENNEIDWMIGEVFTGDAVTALLEEFEKEDQEKINNLKSEMEAAVEKAKAKQKAKTQKEQLGKKADFGKNKEKWLKRKEAAKTRYQNRKNKYARWKKGSTKVAIIPMLDLFVSLINKAVELIETGIYSVGEFVEDANRIFKDTSLEDLKLAYIQVITDAARNNDLDKLNKLSSLQDVIKLVNKLKYNPTGNPPEKTSGYVKDVQEQLDEDEANIIQEVSTFYDVFAKEADVVTIYPNTDSIAQDFEGKSWLSKYVDELKQANTSQEALKNKVIDILKHSGRPELLGLDLSEYYKYHNVEGIEEAILHAILDYIRFKMTTNKYLENANTVRDWILLILLGKEDAVKNNSDVTDDFILKVKSIRDRISAQGYEIVSTNKHFYGVDTDNNKHSLRADIIAVNNETGKVLIGAITSSYKNPTIDFDVVNRYSGVTRREGVTSSLNTVAQIAIKRFGLTVDGLFCLPAMYDEGKPAQLYDPVSIKMLFVQESTDVEQYKTQAKQKVDEYNSLVDDFNACTDQIGQKSRKEQHKELQEFDTDVQYLNYIAQLDQDIDGLNEMVSEVKDEAVRQMEQQELFDVMAAEQQPMDIPVGVEHLMNACESLDVALQYLPKGPAVTQDEIHNLQVVCRKIFDAQDILNELLYTENVNPDDIREDMELIAAAIEKVIRNQGQFQTISSDTMRQWLNGFVPSGNRGNAAQFYYYQNSLLNWARVLRDHIIDDIEDDSAAQVWYSTLLNNYFAELINRARQFATTLPDAAQQSVIIEAANRGLLMLDEFNLEYDVTPDAAYAGPAETEVERLNRVPVKWKDFYGISDKHSPSYDIHKELNEKQQKLYYWITNAVDLLQDYEAFDNGQNVPDVLNRKTKFVLFEDGNGELKFRVVYGKDAMITMPFFVDPDRFEGEDKEYAKRFNRGNKKFVRSVKEKLQYIKDHPEEKLRLTFTVTRNKGKLRMNPTNLIVPLDQFLFADGFNKHDLYSIKVSATDRIGTLMRTKNVTTGGETFNVYAGGIRIGGFDEEYNKNKLALYAGSLVYFYNNGDGTSIGTLLSRKQIGENARDIARLVYRYAVLGQTIIKSGDANYNIHDLLDLVLYLPNDNKHLSEFNVLSNMVNMKLGNPTVYIGTTPYVLTDETLRNNFIQHLSGLEYVTNEEMLNKTMQNSDNSVLQQVVTLIQNGAQQVTLPTGFTITKDDVVNNSTWFGFMIRNGFIGTKAIGKSYRQLNIGNVQIIPITKSNSQSRENTVRDINNHNVSNVSDAMKLLFGKSKKNKSSLFMTVGENELVDRSEDEAKVFEDFATSYFDKVFGNHDDVRIVEDITKNLSGLPTSGTAVGVTLDQLVKIATNAPETTVWHEAFHKLMELILTEEERKQYYDIYRERRGLLFKGKGRSQSDREVAEGLTDVFVGCMTRKGKIDRKDTFLHKLSSYWNKFVLLAGMYYRFGKQGTRTFFDLYDKMNNGKFSSRTVSEANIERFQQTFGQLFHTVKNNDTKRSADFKELSNSAEVTHMVRALSYLILDHHGFVDDVNADPSVITLDNLTLTEIDKNMVAVLTGQGKKESELNHAERAFREVFTEEKILQRDDKGNPYYVKSYPKFDALKQQVKDYITSIIHGYSSVLNDDLNNDEEEKVQNANIDKYDRSSVEFNKLDNVADRVKLFFSTILYSSGIDEDGNFDNDLSKNMFGLPTFMPLEEVYKKVTGDLHDVRSMEELNYKLAELAKHNLMYARLYEKWSSIYNKMYSYDENYDYPVSIDYDAEALCVNIFKAIKSHASNFVIAYSKIKNGYKQVTITSSSEERDSRTFASLWNLFLASGSFGIFNTSRIDGNLSFRSQNDSTVFTDTAAFIEQLISALAFNGESSVGDIKYNPDNISDLEDLKTEFINRLNKIGIQFTKDALDYVLLNKHGSIGKQAFLQWITKKGSGNDITSFIQMLGKMAPKGIPDTAFIDTAYKENGFVNHLATIQSAYNRKFRLNMALGLDGKKLYSITQNNSITHIINAINSANLENETVRLLSNYGFNVTNQNGINVGSVIMKGMLDPKSAQNIQAFTYLGFKTDNRGDTGVEYSDTPISEDYIAKLTMLQQDLLVFPTLADKSTYLILSGIKLPGMKFSQDWTSVTNVPTIMEINGRHYLRPSDAVLDQMDQYAQTERLAIQQCMEDLGYDDIPGYKKQGRRVLLENEKIKNLHTPNKDKNTGKVVEPNGTRFLSLTNLIVEKNGKLISINLNNPNESSKVLLARANEEYFSKPVEERRKIMALTLAQLTSYEARMAEKIGLITRRDIKFQTEAPVILKSEKSIRNLENKNLNEIQINTVQKVLFDLSEWSKAALGSREWVLGRNLCRSLAIAAILQDASIRSIMSSQEVMRCFAGNPAQFKVDYDFENGIIKDSTYDIQKRIGGMVSTGEDNVTDLPYMRSTYMCAEVKDYEVGSTAAVSAYLDDMFIEGEVRDIYGARTGDWKKAYSAPIEELLALEDNYIKEAKKNGKRYADAYKDKINVADGAAYITASMCETMLRARGAFSDKVEKAFRMLENPKTAYKWKDSKKAFDLIYRTLNELGSPLVTTKYTAYGFRNHEVNDQLSSDVAVAYYNKFALFPIFRCNATGPMADIYDKMLNEGVDMLMFDSAVKVGSQGAIKFANGVMQGTFNKYRQELSYLRRQQNTDPEEGKDSNFGTQAVKIVLLNLRLQRTGDAGYVDAEDKEKLRDGNELLTTLMESIKALSDIGENEVLDMFFKADGKTVDNKKLSEFLQKEMGTRNASVAMVEATEAVIDPISKEYRLNSPIAATTNSSWIQSIIIAAINKKVIDVVTPGNSFVQRSVFAIEKTRKDGEGGIQSDADIQNTTINDGEKLQFINEDGSMDAVISIDYFYAMFPQIRDMSFNEARAWLIKNKIIGRGPDVKANTIGYRIPTQAQSSIHALRFVDVVSATQSTIILPEEFTKITGSDFDIDHLYLATYNYKKDKNGDVSLILEKRDKGDNKKYYQNEILRVMLTLLKDKKSVNSLFKSIDNDTDLGKDIADKIEESGSTKHIAYNFGTLHEQTLRRLDYITGKKGIGPFALNVTNQILTYLYGVKFKSSAFTHETRINGLDKLLDKDDHYISSWLSAFINAHVDIVKDPWVTKLNVNPYTYNILSLLVRCGYGDASVWFLCQPIVKDLAEAYQRVNSQYTKDPNKSVYQMRKEAEREVLLRYMNPEDIEESELIKYTGNDERYERNRIDIVNGVLEHPDVLEKYATEKELSQEAKDFQRDVFYCIKTIDKYARALNNLVQHTKIDTRKQGKSFLELHEYYREYTKLFFPKEGKKSIWDVASLHDLAISSWIDKKTTRGTQLPLLIFANQIFEANPDFYRRVAEAQDILEVGDRQIGVDGLKLLSRSYITAIKSRYILDYARSVLNMTDEDLTALFIGNRTISKRLNTLKYCIQYTEKYGYLKNNGLLSRLLIVPETGGENSPEFITVLDNVDDSPIEETDLINGWKDLLEDNDPKVRRFARDLIVYSFLSSGEFNGWNKLFKYVPPTWITGEHDKNTTIGSYSDYIRQQLQKPTYPELVKSVLDDIVANNIFDFRLSERSSLKDDRGDANYVTIQSKSGDVVALVGKELDKSELEDIAPYITVNVNGASRAYKMVGVAAKKGSKKHAPIYVVLKTKGYSYKNNDIYEYGWKFGYQNNGTDYNLLSDQERINSIERVIKARQFDSVMWNMKIPSKRAIEEASVQNIDNEKPSEQQKKWIKATDNYTRTSVLNDPTSLYIFTDNTDRTSGGKLYGDGWYKDKYGEGGFGSENNPTTAQIRGLENAAPISTMRYFYRLHEGMSVADARWKDSDIEEFKKVIDSEIEDIKTLWDSGKFTKIVTPNGDGFFNSRIALISRDSEIGKYLYSKLRELYDYVNGDVSQNLPGPETKMNIWWGSGENDPLRENADLSNFAERSVDVAEGEVSEVLHRYVGKAFKAKFRTVEGAFQAMKIFFSSEDYTRLYIPQGGLPTIGITKNGDQMLTKFENASGSQARSLGRQINGFDKDKWDERSSVIMKALIKASFEQNPQALQRLLATGNATLTHTQDRGKWGTEFPKLLMEVREELRELQPNATLETPVVQNVTLEQQETSQEDSSDYDFWRYNSWLYQEDSSRSGLFDNSAPFGGVDGYMARPKFKFGRIFLTPNDRLYIKESISVVDRHGNAVGVSALLISKLFDELNIVLDELVNNKETVTIQYRDWKQFLQGLPKLVENKYIDQFEYFIEHDVLEYLIQENYMDYPIYDKRNKTYTMDKGFMDLVNVLRRNFEATKLLYNMFDNKDDLMLSLLSPAKLDIYSYFDDYEDYGDDVTLQYSYEDIREQKLFHEEC